MTDAEVLAEAWHSYLAATAPGVFTAGQLLDDAGGILAALAARGYVLQPAPPPSRTAACRLAVVDDLLAAIDAQSKYLGWMNFAEALKVIGEYRAKLASTELSAES